MILFGTVCLLILAIILQNYVFFVKNQAFMISILPLTSFSLLNFYPVCLFGPVRLLFFIIFATRTFILDPYV